MAPRIDSAILKALALDAEHASISTYGGSGFSSTFRIQAKDSTGKKKLYFVKTRKGMDGKIMFIGRFRLDNPVIVILGVTYHKPTVGSLDRT